MKKLSDKRPAWVVNATAPASHTQLMVTEDSDLYLGGLPQDYKVKHGHDWWANHRITWMKKLYICWETFCYFIVILIYVSVVETYQLVC